MRLRRAASSSATRSSTLLRGAGIATALVAAGALAACTGSSGGGASSAVSTSTPPSVTTTTASATVTAGAKATVRVSTPAASSSSARQSGSGGSSGVPVCRESQLKASIDAKPVGGSAKNDFAQIVLFQNTSSSACTVHGYPGAALVNSSGKQVKQATRTIRGKRLGLPASVHTLPTVVLKPGKVASAGLEGVNQKQQGAAQAGCADTYPRVLVTPPNTDTAVPFTLRWPVCYSFTVHPINIDIRFN